MIHFPRWKIILIFIVSIWGVLYALPNIVGGAWMQENLPSFMPGKTVNLGLDLQGGSHLLLDVDVNRLQHPFQSSVVLFNRFGRLVQFGANVVIEYL